MNRNLSATALIASLFVAMSAQATPQRNDAMLNGKSVHGEAVAAPQNARIVNLDAGKSVNVKCGEVITFQKAGKSFSWKFDSAQHRAVDVRTIAPAGFADKPLMVYVSRSEWEGA